MKSASWRHHYIPKFYLNGFTSMNGKFKIYDVSKKIFIKNGAEFTPKSFFYEKDANTLISSSFKNDDDIEKKYSVIDNRIAKLFQRINNSTVQENFNVNEDDMAFLQYFVSIMYWRIPTNYNEVKRIIKKKGLKEFGLILKKTSKAHIDIEQMEIIIKNDVNFFKMMKYWLPNILYPELLNCKTPLHLIPFIEGFPSICSDNPIISINPEKFNPYKDDYIILINNTIAFMRGSKLKKFNSIVKIMIDMLLYKQARKYVCCTDEKYIPLLEDAYKKQFKNLNELRHLIFTQVFE